MTCPSKRKIKAKEQERNDNGTFTKISRITEVLDEWGDENDSEWDDNSLLLNEKKALELVWLDNTHLKQKNAGHILPEK